MVAAAAVAASVPGPLQRTPPKAARYRSRSPSERWYARLRLTIVAESECGRLARLVGDTSVRNSVAAPIRFFLFSRGRAYTTPIASVISQIRLTTAMRVALSLLKSE